ncbi:MAG: peptidylprolyl isomerase [Planctomycetota bacterium]
MNCRSKSTEESQADKPEPNAVVTSVADDVAVTVNGVDILRSEVEKLIRPQLDAVAEQARQQPPQVLAQIAAQFRQETLEQLIRRQLLDGKIQQANIIVTDEEVMSQIEEIASAQELSVEDFFKTMEQYGNSAEEIKEDVRRGLSRNKFMEIQWAGKINVTEDDAKQYYDEKPERFRVPEQVRVSHILITPESGADPNEAKVKARIKSEDLHKQIKDGADFAELARANSSCPSAPDGGDLNFFPRGKTTPAFEKVAFDLEAGQISDVVETEYGYHIIKATGHKDPSVISFERAKDRIIAQLTAQKQSAFAENFLKTLKAEAEIVYPTGQ